MALMERLKMPSLAIRIGLAVGIIIIGIVIWTKVMARWGNGSPPAAYPVDQQADLIVVNKAARHLVLMRQGRVLAAMLFLWGPVLTRAPNGVRAIRKPPKGVIGLMGVTLIHVFISVYIFPIPI